MWTQLQDDPIKLIIFIGGIFFLFFALKLLFDVIKAISKWVFIFSILAALAYAYYYFEVKKNAPDPLTILTPHKDEWDDLSPLRSGENIIQPWIESGKVSLKEGVSIYGLRTEIANAVPEIVESFAQAKCLPVWITSGSDSHPLKSQHSNGLALDIRLKQLTPKQRSKIIRSITQKIGPKYFILHEDVGKNNEHLHIHWKRQPKKPSSTK